MKAVVTVVGKDKVGIIARVSTLFCENNINILDISQTIMQDMFTMIMLVELEKESVKKINEELAAVADEMGLSIHLQNQKLFNSMHRI
ncbi:MAG: ACT domain-containing protein [Clostridia bacterium]|nr:ACT domain-containing protein [Clostridia bacterium]